MILYIGYDGSYVLCRRPLHKLWDADGGNHYLAPRTGKCVDVADGNVVFDTLGLKKWDVIKVNVRVPLRAKKTRRKK